MEEFLRHIRGYVPLAPAEERLVRGACREATYSRGDYLVRRGRVCRRHTFIVAGRVRTFYSDAAGGEHVVAFGIDDHWVGDLGSLITGRPADFDVECLARTRVVELDVGDVERLFAAAPAVERLFRLIIQNAYVGAQRRIVRNFSLPARERYELFLAEHPDVARQVPVYMIASYLGITREFLSAIRGQIAREGARGGVS